MVPTAAVKATAEIEARKVDGVKGVSNDLQVVAVQKQDAVAAKSEGGGFTHASVRDDGHPRP